MIESIGFIVDKYGIKNGDSFIHRQCTGFKPPYASLFR